MNQKDRQVKLVLFQAGKDQNNLVRKHEGHGQKRSTKSKSQYMALAKTEFVHFC